MSVIFVLKQKILQFFQDEKRWDKTWDIHKQSLWEKTWDTVNRQRWEKTWDIANRR